MDTRNSHEAEHLCVLVHGLWGNPNHLEVMAKSLRAKHPEQSLHILVAKRNSGSFTYDGIERGGERVCQEIEEEIEKLAKAGQEIKRLSMVGYSLGGLVARYAVGLLDSKGFFEKIKPVNFTTFASPHLGVRTPLRGWHNHIWNVLGARTLSASGRQLFTIDNFRDTGKPLLEILADPESIFIKGLAKFERRTLYTNIINDRSAVYYTTGISRNDPFTNLDKIKVNYLKGYDDVILDPACPVASTEPEQVVATYYDTLVRSSQTTLGRLPFLLAMVFFIPFGVVAFLVNAGVQSIRSNRRIRLHETGLAGIQPSNYRVPLLINGMREAVEDVYENLNSAQSNEYLANGIDEEAEPGSPVLERPQSSHAVSKLNLEEEKTGPAQEVPTLALADYQFRMVQALDDVGWRKYPVYIHKVRHSHAAIIVRVDKESFDEGRVVLKHWLEEEFIA
ncbi:related to lipase/serine esterase [Phialocephala subalpina]|uniref:Related to lipase/serine esterase n=1 Tax=Phialocephala subalpina TaxID=576137 RepID=A0A1L7WJ26_9HELO|nr:related to lipase/serine esterase [Phialocephala subalpina]